MGSLLDLSHEILHSILTHVDPADLASLSRSCGTLHGFIKDNKLLHKALYLQRWDHPAGDEEPTWDAELRKLVTLEKILDSHNVEQKRDHLEFVASAIFPLLTTPTADSNPRWLAEKFSSQDNIDGLLASSSLFKMAGTSTQVPALTPELQQLSAKLHCHYGIPIDSSPPKCPMVVDGLFNTPFRSPYHIIYPPHSRNDSHDHLTRSQTQQHIPANHVARAKVYDLRQYTDGSLWGPFKDDGTSDVDWEKVEAVMVVLGYNLRLCCDQRGNDIFSTLWTSPFEDLSPGSFVSPPPKIPAELGEPGPLDARDPYGITGMWMRVVCFLDYNDLYAFNFGTPISADQSRQPIDTKEAIRLIRLKLQVTKIEPPGEDDGQDLPVVTFKGTSRSLHASWDPNANSKIRGVVRQTKEGHVRWTTWSIFHGEERWRSEGVQVGGLRSARGVLGNWFDKDYDIHGPAGPTAFWKLSDHVIDESDEDVTQHPLFSILASHSDDEEDEDSNEEGEDEDEDDGGDEEGEGDVIVHVEVLEEDEEIEVIEP